MFAARSSSRVFARPAAYPLVLIRAPAGYAKTSVLAEWAEQDDRPFAWVSLTSRDDDATRLLNRLVEAVDGVSLKGRPFVLVVDNADVVRSQGASDALANVITSLRPDGQIVLASRKEPRLPLGRMRAQREVFELTRRDLAMSRLESAGVARGARAEAQPGRGRRSPSSKSRAGPPLCTWRALPRTGARHGVRRFARFAGDDQFVSDYVRDEFLSGISLARLRFFIRSSILRGPRRAESVTRSRALRVGTGPARAVPRESAPRLPRSCRRLVPLPPALQPDAPRGAAPPRARPREPPPRRASAWYAGRERFEEAIDHAIEAGEETRRRADLGSRGAFAGPRRSRSGAALAGPIQRPEGRRLCRLALYRRTSLPNAGRGRIGCALGLGCR